MNRFKFRYFVFASLATLSFLFVQNSLAFISSERDKVDFYITDFGIRQWESYLKTGDDFSQAHNRVFNNIPRSGQILIVMPPDGDFKKMTKEQIIHTIYEKLKKRIDDGLAVGTTTFELQLVQHIGIPGYVNRQKIVNDFGECAYKAIGMVNDYLKTKGLSTYNYAMVGSNGAKVLTENVLSWKSYLQGVSMYDGRAFRTPTVDTIKALGEKNVHIFNTAGDWAAPNNPFVHSIGNHEVTKKLKKIFPGIQVVWLDPIDRLDHPFGAGHIAGMNSNSRFLAKTFTGDSYTTPEEVLGSDLYPNTRLGVFVGNVNALEKTSINISSEGQNWYRVQRENWLEPVHVRGVEKEESEEQVAESVLQKANALGISKEETIVVGGDPESDKLKLIVKAIQERGFKVKVVDTSDLTFNEALIEVAEKAHDIDSSLGVLVGDIDVPMNVLLQGDWQGVFKAITQDNSKENDSITRIIMGHAYLATNRVGKASAIFASLNQEELGQWLKWTGDLVENHKSNAVSHYLLADALAREEWLDKALETLDRSIAIDTQFGLAYATRGIVRIIQKGTTTTEALIDLLKATQYMPESAYTQAAMGFYWIVLKTPGEAEKFYTKALEIDSNFGEAYIGRAIARFGQGYFEEALNDLDKVANVSSGELVDLSSSNRARLLTAVNRFLHEIEKYTANFKPGTTLETRFRFSEIVIDAKVMPVYIFQPSNDFENTRSAMGQLARDLSQRLDKPIRNIDIMVHAHGWGSSGSEHRVFAARMASVGGKDAAIVVDLPELRGYISHKSKGIDRIGGKLSAAFRWSGASNLAGRNIANTGKAVDDVFGHPASFSGHSGGAEAFIKQGMLKNMKLPKWDQVMLMAYPFHDALRFSDVRVPEKLTNKCKRIVNFVTTPGHWSNTLRSSNDKVTNIPLTLQGRGIPHTALTSEKIRGLPNPVFAASVPVLHGYSINQVQRTANFVNRTTPIELPKQKVREVIEPLTGFSKKTKAFGHLPSMDKYINLQESPHTGKPDRRQVVHDTIVRPFPALQAIGVMNNLIGLAGGIGGKTGPAETPGPLQGRTITDYRFSAYEGALRLKVLKNGDYGLFKFYPKKDTRGHLTNTDPFHNANWELLTKENAIDRLHSSMRYQTKVHGNPDPSFNNLFKKTTGYRWGNWFALLTTHDPKLSKILKLPRDGGVELNVQGIKINTTFGSYLEGNFSQNKLERAFAEEYAMTYQYRQKTGQNIGFRHWFEGSMKGNEAALNPSPFQNIGATSHGMAGRPLADVWHRNVKWGMDINKTVQETKDLAVRKGAKDVSLVYNLTGKTLADDYAKKLKANGLNVELIQNDRLSMMTMVGAGMGSAVENVNNSSVVIGIDGTHSRTGVGDISNNFDNGFQKPSGIGSVIQLKQHMLVNNDEDLAKIPSLASNLGVKWGGRVTILGTGDLRSSLLDLQLNDRGYDAIRIAPYVHMLKALKNTQSLDSVIAVQPSFQSNQKSNLKLITPYPAIPGKWKPDEHTPPDLLRQPFNWNVIGPVLKDQGFRHYEQPRPPKLPGGVSTKEFAKTWVDNGDWPLWVCAPGGYGQPLLLVNSSRK